MYRVRLTETIEAENMLWKSRTKSIMSGLGDRDYVRDWILINHAKSYKYLPNTYYRVLGGSGSGYAGVGNGLYLGRDKDALLNFYADGDDLPVARYTGNPNWLDLLDYKDFEKFKKLLSTKGIGLVNSDEVGQYVIGLGFDGIRYYDPLATGEEFVLFNQKALKKG